MSVGLSVSFSIPGRHLKKGESTPCPRSWLPHQGGHQKTGWFPTSQIPTPGWPPRDGLVSHISDSHTRVATKRRVGFPHLRFPHQGGHQETGWFPTSQIPTPGWPPRDGLVSHISDSHTRVATKRRVGFPHLRFPHQGGHQETGWFPTSQIPTPGWPPRDGLVSHISDSHTRVATKRRVGFPLLIFPHQGGHQETGWFPTSQIPTPGWPPRDGLVSHISDSHTRVATKRRVGFPHLRFPHQGGHQETGWFPTSQIPTPGWPPRDGLVSHISDSHTRVATKRRVGFLLLRFPHQGGHQETGWFPTSQIPTPGWPPRDGLVSHISDSHTRVATKRRVGFPHLRFPHQGGHQETGWFPTSQIPTPGWPPRDGLVSHISDSHTRVATKRRVGFPHLRFPHQGGHQETGWFPTSQIPTPGWPPRDGLVSYFSDSHTRVATKRRVGFPHLRFPHQGGHQETGWFPTSQIPTPGWPPRDGLVLLLRFPNQGGHQETGWFPTSQIPKPGWPPRDGLVSYFSYSHTRVATEKAGRDAPKP